MEEYFDILNEQGKPTDEAKPRSEVHKNGYWHKASHVWIINNKSELLLQHRTSDRETSPNKWTVSASGHVKSGDTEISTAIQETFEEIGVQLNEIDLNFVGVYKKSRIHPDKNIIDNEFDYIYVVKMDVDLSKCKFDKVEVQELKYMEYNEFKHLYLNSQIDVVPIKKEYYDILFPYLDTFI